jgi:hypothetical protein
MRARQAGLGASRLLENESSASQSLSRSWERLFVGRCSLVQSEGIALGFLSREEINSGTRWLLENASPPVRYLTHKHILKMNPQSGSMKELWRCVEQCSAAEEIFSRQNEDGSWFSGGPWGPRGYRQKTGRGYTPSRPKFVTTAWILPFLGEMGFTVDDERIRKSCETMLQETGSYRHGADLPPQAANCCGLYAIPLRALASVGMAPDERLRGGWDRLALCQRTDGGWLNPNHLADSPTPSKTKGRWPWDKSCAWGSFFAVQALFYSENAHHRRALAPALEFLLWHLSQKNPEHIQTWVYHGHNTVKELLMWSEAGFDMRVQPIQALLDWLKGYYRPSEGMFRTQDKPITNFVRHVSAITKEFAGRYGAAYWATVAKTGKSVLRYHLYHLVEDDWLTYYLIRIAQNMSPEPNSL